MKRYLLFLALVFLYGCAENNYYKLKRKFPREICAHRATNGDCLDSNN